LYQGTGEKMNTKMLVSRLVVSLVLGVTFLIQPLQSGRASKQSLDSNLAQTYQSVIIQPTANLVTSEDGLSDTFSISLSSQPLSPVKVSFSSSNTNEGLVSPSEVTLNKGNWNKPQTVTVTGVDDAVIDGPVEYSIITGPAASSDPSYNNLDPLDVQVTNLDNDTILANDDSDVTDEDTPVTTNVLANDVYIASSVTLTILVNPSHGSVQITVDNHVTYSPDPDFNGLDSYEYQICSSPGDCSSAIVTISILAVNDPPAPVDDIAVTESGVPILIPVLSNDSDLDGDALQLQGFDSTSLYGGTIARDDNQTPDDLSDDRLIYTSASTFAGDDLFKYWVNDGNLTVDANVDITVNATPQMLVANDDSYSLPRNTTLSIDVINGVLQNDSLVTGSTLTCTLVSGVSYGVLTLNLDGSFTYTPDTDYVGEDSFVYQTEISGIVSNPANVILSVTNGRPVANDDYYTTEPEQALQVNPPGVLANDSDPENEPLAIVLEKPPDYGTLNIQQDGSFYYQPEPGFSGIATFTYYVDDGEKTSKSAQVQIDVADRVIPTLQWVAPVTSEERYDIDGGLVRLEAEANDNIAVAAVHFFRWDPELEQYVDIATVTQSPYEYYIDSWVLSPAWNQIFARAYDSYGNGSIREFIWIYKVVSYTHRLYLPVIHTQ
jgi:hypothetical protein